MSTITRALNYAPFHPLATPTIFPAVLPAFLPAKTVELLFAEFSVHIIVGHAHPHSKHISRAQESINLVFWSPHPRLKIVCTHPARIYPGKYRHEGFHFILL